MANTPATNENSRQRPALVERLETRVSAEEKDLLQRAANLENRSVTDFVRSSARAAAIATIHRHESMTLAALDSAVFVEELMNPQAPGPQLRAAARAHRDLIGE